MLNEKDGITINNEIYHFKEAINHSCTGCAFIWKNGAVNGCCIAAKKIQSCCAVSRDDKKSIVWVKSLNTSLVAI